MLLLLPPLSTYFDVSLAMSESLSSDAVASGLSADRIVPISFPILALPLEVIFEIVALVASEVDEPTTKGTLYSLVLTCQMISSVALDFLWGSFQHSLLPLLHCFGVKPNEPPLWIFVHDLSVRVHNVLSFAKFDRTFVVSRH